MIPELKSTGDAIAFGKVASLEEIEEVKEMMVVYKSYHKSYKGLPVEEALAILKENAIWSYKGQWLRETVEVYEGTFNFL